MLTISEQEPANEKGIAEALKGWMMIGLTITFVGLYTAALTGLLRPLTDVIVIARLEPLIFVILGYYFGRLPSQYNEKILKKGDRSANKKG